VAEVPEELRYSEDHEWAAETEGSKTVRVGITDFAQDQLGDVVYVQLPEVDATVGAGDPVGEVESTKSVSELLSPVAGTITAVNDALTDAPELLNTDPYGEGWIFELAVEGDLDDLLDARAYTELTNKD